MCFPLSSCQPAILTTTAIAFGGSAFVWIWLTTSISNLTEDTTIVESFSSLVVLPHLLQRCTSRCQNMVCTSFGNACLLVPHALDGDPRCMPQSSSISKLCAFFEASIPTIHPLIQYDTECAANSPSRVQFIVRARDLPSKLLLILLRTSFLIQFLRSMVLIRMLCSDVMWFVASSQRNESRKDFFASIVSWPGHVSTPADLNPTSFFGVARVGMVMHAMWMISEKD